MIRRDAVVVRLTSERGDLLFDRDDYIALFGPQQGGLLFTEFESIISRPALPSEDGNQVRLMQVYVSIWRVLGASWTENIASIQRARKQCPPECKSPLL
jgi:hypothetical protein